MLDTVSKTGSQAKITVLNPVGYPPKITKKSAAPTAREPRRQDDLSGRLPLRRLDRTAQAGAGLVRRAHAERQDQASSRCRQHYSTTIRRPGKRSRRTAHAAIVGVGHCSTCAPAVATHAITLETKYGVPTVALHTDKFDRVVQSVDHDGGPAGRAARLRAAAGDGQDRRGAARLRLRQGPDHRQAGDAGGHRGAHARSRRTRASVAFERTTPRLVEPDTEDNLQRQFLDNNWTDGLPIVLPTEKRVAAMLAHTSRKPDEVVGRMQPTANFAGLGIHGREGRGERRDGRRAAGILPGHPGARGLAGVGARLAPRARPRRWSWSTVRSATRSA